MTFWSWRGNTEAEEILERGENQGPRNKGTQSDILFNHMPDVNIVSRSLNPNFLPNIKSGIKLN